jgi:GT2 family glycosyltransferase
LDTAVVIVSYNTRELLLECLRSLADDPAGPAEIVVVDNGSHDGSLEAVAAAHPDVRLVALRHNAGYGAAANAGVRASKAAVAIVTNPDTTFAPGAVAAMASYLESHPKTGAVGPLLLNPDGSLQFSARPFPSVPLAAAHAFLGLFWESNPASRAYLMAGWDHATEREVDWVSGACIALRRKAFDGVGGFDEAYFMYVEDVDLCWRMRREGWRIGFTPEAKVTHHVGKASRVKPWFMIVAHHRSLWRFSRKRHTGLAGLLVAGPVAAGLALRAVGVYLLYRFRARRPATAGPKMEV